jgi:multidrug efflux system membrane fusion protein
LSEKVFGFVFPSLLCESAQMIRRTVWVTLLLAALTGAYLAYQSDERVRTWVSTLTGAVKNDRHAKKRTPPPAPVRVTRARTQTVPVRLEGVGNVQARSSVAVKARIDGQLFTAGVKEGQAVRKGDVLFQLDPRPFEAQLKQAEANLARDKANLAKARSDLARIEDLAGKGISPKAKLDEVEASVATFLAAISSSEAAIELAKLSREYATIRSPIDGRVGKILVAPGNMVKANDTQPLLVINEVKPIYVAFALPEQYLDELRRRMAEGPLAVEAAWRGESASAVTGELFFINNAVDTTTGTIELMARFANEDERLVPGQFIKAGVTVATLPNAVVVPSQAVQINQKGEYVWILKGDNTVQLRPITIGPQAGDATVVTKGLASGEVVVTDGQLRLFPGASVAPVETKRNGSAAKARS